MPSVCGESCHDQCLWHTGTQFYCGMIPCALLTQTVASALGAREESERPLLTRLTDSLREKQSPAQSIQAQPSPQANDTAASSVIACPLAQVSVSR